MGNFGGEIQFQGGEGDDDAVDAGGGPVLAAEEVLLPLHPAWPGPRRLGAENRFL